MPHRILVVDDELAMREVARPDGEIADVIAEPFEVLRLPVQLDDLLGR